MRQVGGWRETLRVWNRNAVKFGCDDCCTPINKIHYAIKKKEGGSNKQPQKGVNLYGLF